MYLYQLLNCCASFPVCTHMMNLLYSLVLLLLLVSKHLREISASLAAKC